MDLIDFKKDLTYKAKTDPAIIDVPEMLFVMVDGKGAPDSSDEGETEFQTAMQILFGVVYTNKLPTSLRSGYCLFQTNLTLVCPASSAP